MRLISRPRDLSTMHGNLNSSTIGYIKRKAEKDILPIEAKFYPNGLGISRPYIGKNEPIVLYKYADMDDNTLGLPLIGNLKSIRTWFEEHGVFIPQIVIDN